MAAVLLILKIIGVIVLVMLVVLLISLFAALFVPTKYKIDIDAGSDERYEEFPGAEILSNCDMTADVSWLFRFLHATARYRAQDHKAEFSVRICGIRLPVERLLGVGKKEKKDKKPEPEKTSEQSGLYEKLRKIKNKTEYYKRVLTSSCAERAFAVIQTQLSGMMFSLLPDTFDIEGAVGLGDPAATGKAMQYASYLYPIAPEHLRVRFDFEWIILKLSGYIKGKIRLSSLVFPALRIILNRDVRHILSALRRGEKQKGRKRAHAARSQKA